ncbi:MAG: hypothetical protein RIS26_122 [Actinomycetota bacterium]
MYKNKQQRALHVVDVENEIMSGNFGVTDVVRLHTAWDATVPVGETDQFYLASGTRTKEALAFGWQNARIEFRPGKDGADDALVEYLDIAYVARQFTHVYIGSGDHKLQPSAKALIEAGVTVIVVGRRKAIHHSFYTIPVQIVYLDEGWDLAA